MKNLEDTNLALALIQSSVQRCYASTGSKTNIVVISQEMADKMDSDVLGVFAEMAVVDDKLPGFSCYALKAVRV